VSAEQGVDCTLIDAIPAPSKGEVSLLKNMNEAIQGKKGVLVVIEGISGSGKSEGITRLSSYLQARGMTTRIVEWNSNKRIRSLVNKLHDRGMLNAFVYSILQWISFLIDLFRVIFPALKQNEIVIADRYVYTGMTRDAVNGAGRFLGRMMQVIAREPDLVLFYDTPPTICYERIKARGKALFHTNKYIHRSADIENKDLYYLKEIHKAYMKLFREMEMNNNVIYVHEKSLKVNSSVEEFINQKMGRAHYRAYNH
jgi:dTMP kinase